MLIVSLVPSPPLASGPASQPPAPYSGCSCRPDSGSGSSATAPATEAVRGKSSAAHTDDESLAVFWKSSTLGRREWD